MFILFDNVDGFFIFKQISNNENYNKIENFDILKHVVELQVKKM